VTSRATFRTKLKKDFGYDEKLGLQTIAVPSDTRDLDNSFHLRDRGLPSFWVVDMRDNWKVVYQNSAGTTTDLRNSCAIPASKGEHGAYIDRMTSQLSLVLDEALAADSGT